MDQVLIDHIKQTRKSKFVAGLIARGKPTMTYKDQWWSKNLNHRNPKYRKRAEFIAEWYRYVDAVKISFNNIPLTDELIIECRFWPPMTWTTLKKKRAYGQYHNVKPDADNIIKGIADALVKKDQLLGLEMLWKVWVDPVEEKEGICIYYK